MMNKTQKFTGFLDIRDLVSFIVFVYDEQKVEDNSRLQELIKHGVGQFKMLTTDGVTVSYLSRRHRFRTVHENDPLLKVTDLLAEPDIHRVPSVDDSGKIVNIISQTSVIKLLADKCTSVLNDDDKVSIGELQMGTHPVLSVNQNESVINTLRIMDVKNKSGIAIVDAEGRLVGTTTGKDLGLFLKNPTLAVLNQPIFQFLQKVRSESVADIRTPCISLFEKDTLSHAAALLAATKVHRIYVVSDEQHFQPIRVISITDILVHLTKNK